MDLQRTVLIQVFWPTFLTVKKINCCLSLWPTCEVWVECNLFICVCVYVCIMVCVCLYVKQMFAKWWFTLFSFIYWGNFCTVYFWLILWLSPFFKINVKHNLMIVYLCYCVYNQMGVSHIQSSIYAYRAFVSVVLFICWWIFENMIF